MGQALRNFRALAPVTLGFILLLAIAASSAMVLVRQQTATQWVRHTLQVENVLTDIRALIVEAESGQRGFLLTDRELYLESTARAERELPGRLTLLRRQVSDNPAQLRAAAALEDNIAERLTLIRANVRAQRGGFSAADRAAIDSDRAYYLGEGIRQLIGMMRTEEQRLLGIREARSKWLAQLALAALIASIVLGVLLAVFTLRDARSRLGALAVANDRLVREAQAREAAEEQARQMQKMQAVGQLTGGIAHDFNNMLAIVVGSLDMARRRIDGAREGLERYLDQAMEGAQRAADLTKRLLAFSRQQPLEPKALDANKLVSGMSELLRRTLGEGVQIETVLAGGLWKAKADPGQLENALVNLAVNARDAMPEGGKLTIETNCAHLDDAYAATHAEVKAGQYVVLCVTDTGTGMTPEVASRAFDPFYTTKEVGQGTGLGLSQIYGFVKQSGGHVKIYSEVDVGTTVKLYLPRFFGEGEVEPEPHAAIDYPLARPNEVVLVVEDEAQVRHVSVDTLRELGYSVISATNPASALEQIELRDDIDLLFTDIVMPEMNGRQLAETAAKIRPALRILYTTGYTRNAVVHNGQVDPGIAFIAKPFTIEQLARKVREVLDGARSATE